MLLPIVCGATGKTNGVVRQRQGTTYILEKYWLSNIKEIGEVVMDDIFSMVFTSREKNPLILDDDDIFAPLLGSWDTEYSDDKRSNIKGEWHFSRALDGMAVADVFICPSRQERLFNPQEDGEWGITIRMYDRKTRSYDMTYVCQHHTKRLTAKKEGDRIVCFDHESGRQWIFHDITDESFSWCNGKTDESGLFRISCKVSAVRRTRP